MMSSQDILIQRIEAYREQHGMSYMELAGKLDIPYTTLTEMLRRRRVPRIDTVDMLANAMGMETCTLLSPPVGETANEQKASMYEEEILAVIRKLSGEKKELLMMYLRLLEETDAYDSPDGNGASNKS